MRTCEPSCNVAAAGAGDCAAVFAAEEDGADSRPDAAAAAADAGDGIATSAASQFVVSMAVGAEAEGAARRTGGARAAHVDCGCDGARGLPHTRTTAVNIAPCVAAAEASAVSSPRMQPAHHSVRYRSKCTANNAARTQRQRPRLSAQAQAPTRRCTRCGAAGRAAASRQQSFRAPEPRQQARDCRRRCSFERPLGSHVAPPRERGVQCWRRGQAAASDDCDFKRTERYREIEGRESNQSGEGRFNANPDVERARTLS
jgi:hypothetical protein